MVGSTGCCTKIVLRGVVVVPGARLTLEERQRIEAWWAAGHHIAEIARRVGRHRSTVLRELTRNKSWQWGVKNPYQHRFRPGCKGIYRSGYDCSQAHYRARLRARRPKVSRVAAGQPLRPVVVGWLQDRFSPEQISGRLRLEYPDRPEMQMSHEALYQALYLQTRGALREELKVQQALRSGRPRRRPAKQPAGAVRSRRPWVKEFPISQRPAEAADRAVPGHWEGDLVIGAYGRSAMVTLVERTTRYVLLGELPQSRVSEEVIDVLSALIGALPEHLRRSLTWDQGSELAQHARFTVATGCPVFFCDPHSPWQRGSNENTNGLLRQYFPKSTFDFRTIDQGGLDDVAHQLNRRPRETLGWHTPAEKLNELLGATAA
jgi:IS30 family transposase